MDPSSTFHSRDLPLPKEWSERIMAAVLQTLGLAHFVATRTRADASNSRLPEVRARGEADAAKGAEAAGRQVQAIKDGLIRRMMKVIDLPRGTPGTDAQQDRRPSGPLFNQQLSIPIRPIDDHE